MSDESRPTISPKSILDVIKEEYPEKYMYMLRYCANKNQLFSEEEWRNILFKSRQSYEEYLKASFK
ncbi:MAG: hypothetical protein GXW85_04310 [Clostridia bacterium]|nr:hypothetical protein [Clostridia bacterium]